MVEAISEHTNETVAANAHPQVPLKKALILAEGNKICLMLVRALVLLCPFSHFMRGLFLKIINFVPVYFFSVFCTFSPICSTCQ